METFTQLFGDLLAFVYHCFDRIVIYGYLSGLSRPEQVVHFFRNVVGVAVVDKEVFSRRTADFATARHRTVRTTPNPELGRSARRAFAKSDRPDHQHGRLASAGRSVFGRRQ